MGASIRDRLSGLGRSEGEQSMLTETDVETALGRLSAYDAAAGQNDRRRPLDSVPPLHRRRGLWRR